MWYPYASCLTPAIVSREICKDLANVCCLTRVEKGPTYHCFLLCSAEQIVVDRRISNLKCRLLSQDCVAVKTIVGQVVMAAVVALYKKWKKSTKIGIVRRPGARYLYRWQMLTKDATNDQNWCVGVICNHRFRHSFRGAYGLTRWFGLGLGFFICFMI